MVGAHHRSVQHSVKGTTLHNVVCSASKVRKEQGSVTQLGGRLFETNLEQTQIIELTDKIFRAVTVGVCFKKET